MFKRLVITCFNIVFPPVAVALLAGAGEDLLFNSLLFLCAIIPSHIHGFYISLTYFNRKRKMRKGVYPGKRRRMIWSDRVNNGGASNREVERLRKLQQQGDGGALEKVGSRTSGRSNRQSGVPMSPISQVGSRHSKRYSRRQMPEVPSRGSSQKVVY